MRTKYKSWAKPYIEEHKEVMLDIEQISNINSLLNIEIGSGKGKFLVEMAKKFPDKLFIGIEMNVTCAGITAKKIVDEELNNAKLVFANAMDILANLKDNSVNAIYLNFSDPWPKKRHTKRRLTSIKFLNEYYRVLTSKGRIIFKTDNDGLFSFTLDEILSTPFKVISSEVDYDGLDINDVQTEYEISFRNKNKNINRLVLEK